MADTASVAGYLAALPSDKRAGLEKLRRTLKRLLPKAEECISYGIPAFRNPDGVIVYFAAMKSHLSFFPTSHPIEVCAQELKGYATSRGTIRFPIDTPLPDALVAKLVKVRLKQMAEKRAVRPQEKKGPALKVRPRLNAVWHASHPMPKNAKLPERAAWHMAHQRHCGCREIPASISAYLAQRGRGDAV